MSDPAGSLESKESCDKVRKKELFMQRRARITSKGQITVPREIRRLLGVRPGDGLLFETDEAGTRVRPARAGSPFAKYRGIGNPGVSSGKKAIVQRIRELRGQ